MGIDFGNNSKPLKAGDLNKTAWIEFAFRIQISESHHGRFKRTPSASSFVTNSRGELDMFSF